MNAAPQPGNRSVPDALETFRVKLLVILNGGETTLSMTERMWLTAFRVAASRSTRRLDEGESFDLSFDALVRCRTKGKDDNYRYVIRACVNAHHNHLRAARRKPGRARERSYNPWGGVDARLDLEDALVRMGKVYPTFERVVRLRRQGYAYAEIGHDFGVGAKCAERITGRAERCLRAFLGEAYERP